MAKLNQPYCQVRCIESKVADLCNTYLADGYELITMSHRVENSVLLVFRKIRFCTNTECSLPEDKCSNCPYPQ